METGAVVNLTAMRGMETRKIPSAKLLAIAANQSRLKAGEKLLLEAIPDITLVP
jgi:hypothetical protein